jgi:DNA-binding FrmR family transcriptional regulator
MFYTSGCGRIEIQLTKKQAAKGSHSGKCDNDIAELRQLPAIKKQLDKINPEILKNELREYGAWDEIELSKHDDNLTRILWIACGDILESTFN